MNVLTIFEQRISAIFEEEAPGQRKPFSFKRLAKRAVREMEDETFVIDGVDTAPALYTVLVSQRDDELMRPMYVRLCDEVSQLVEAQAKKRGYAFVGRPLVRFMTDPALRGGKFSVFAENIDPRTLARLRDEENAYLGLTTPQEIPFEQGFVPEQVPVDEMEPAPIASEVAFASAQEEFDEVVEQDFEEPADAVEDEPVAEEVQPDPVSQMFEEVEAEFAEVAQAEVEEEVEDAFEAADAELPEADAMTDDVAEDASADALADEYDQPASAEVELDAELAEEALDADDDARQEPPVATSGFYQGVQEDADAELAADAGEGDEAEGEAPLTERVDYRPRTRGRHFRVPPAFEDEDEDEQEAQAEDEPETTPEPEAEAEPEAEVEPEPEPEAPSYPVSHQHDTCTLTDVATGRTYQILIRCTPIGRERREGGIVLRDPNVSRRHAELLFEDGVWRIRDLNSTNGTLVDDMDVREAVLADGDVITIGLTNLEFRAG